MKEKEREVLRKETQVETLEGGYGSMSPLTKGSEEGPGREQWLETNQAGAGANKHVALQGFFVAHWRTVGLRVRGKKAGEE